MCGKRERERKREREIVCVCGERTLENVWIVRMREMEREVERERKRERGEEGERETEREKQTMLEGFSLTLSSSARITVSIDPLM